MTRPMLRPALAAVVCLVALLPAAPALASTRDKIISDCADDGVLQGHYTPSQIRDARQHLPSDVAEYTDCADALRRAEMSGGSTAAAGGGGGGGTSGGGTAGGGGGTTSSPVAVASGVGRGPLLAPATASDHKTLHAAAKSGGRPVHVNGQSVVPGAAGLQAGAIRNPVPTTLIAALALLAAAGLALAVPGLRRALPRLGRRGT